MIKLCKIGIHDYEILECAFSDKYKMLTEDQRWGWGRQDKYVYTYRKKICIKCGKVVDEIEKAKKYFENKAKIEEERQALAKKYFENKIKREEERQALAKTLYENKKEVPPAIFNKFEELCIDYCKHCVQRAKEHPVDIREDAFSDNMIKMFKHPIIAECYKKCNIESAEAKWYIDKCTFSLKYRPWSQVFYNTREFTIEEFKTFND